MNILMMTNTYTPHVGGVARSVATISDTLRRRGHRVLVVAPTFETEIADEVDVIRVPAIQQFNGSDFSVRLPIPGFLTSALGDFEPNIIHSHHPFLLGDTALRVAARRAVPIVFTNHTMYEQYTHYVPGDSPAMKRFAIRLATEYANLCDRVIAPSESIAAILKQRGVERPISAIPTGIDPQLFASGSGEAARRRWGIPPEAVVVGHVGRLAPEKNLLFLTQCLAQFLKQHQGVHVLLVGTGPLRDEIHETMQKFGVAERLHHPKSPLVGQALADAYEAMDVFAFASQSETQGMVLAEAMTAGVPVVAIDACGVREIVRDGVNGRLLSRQSEQEFVEALHAIVNLSPVQRAAMVGQARQTAEPFSIEACTDRLLEAYAETLAAEPAMDPLDDGPLATTLRMIEEEWKIWAGVGQAVGDALLGPSEDTPSP